MHEFSIHMEERKIRVERERRRQLDHADNHQRRHLAGGTRHGEDQAGHDAGGCHREQNPGQRLELGGAQRQRTFADPFRNRGERLLGGDDHHRHGQERQGQARPEDAAGAEGRGRQPLREEQAVDAAADAVDEEAEAEDAVDDGGNTGQVVDGDAHHAGHQAVLGVFAQVDGGDHAEREREDAHQEHHHDRAEDGRKEPPFGIRFARVIQQQFADPLKIRSALGEERHAVGALQGNDIHQGDILAAAGNIAELGGYPADVGLGCGGLLVQAGEFRHHFFAGGGQFADFGSVLFLAAIFEFQQFQPETLGGIVQVRHLLFDFARCRPACPPPASAPVAASHTATPRSG